VIRTKPHPTYEAGDRTGRLPETLALDFDEFQKAFAAGKGARSAKPATTNGKDRK